MKQRKLLPFVIILMWMSALFSYVQTWSVFLAPSRGIDWSGSGVVGGIPNRATRCGIVIAAYSGSASTINTAISNCPAGQYVELGSGTFTLSSGVELSKDNVTLRGQGADVTILN